MELTINNKEYNLNFGIKFIRELDVRFPKILKDVPFAFGLQMKIPELLAGNIVALSEIVYCGILANGRNISLDEVDTWLDNLNTTELEVLFDDVLKALEKTNSGKLVISKLKENLK